MNTKILNTKGRIGAATILTLLLGTGSWMAARSQQALSPTGDQRTPLVPTAGATKIGTAEIPILFASAIEDEKVRAWVPTEPVQEVDLPLKGAVKVKWLSDHSGILAVENQGPLVFRSYDREKHQFGQAQSVAKTLGNPGADYDLQITALQDFAPSPDGAGLVFGDEKGVHLFDLKTGSDRLLLTRSTLNKRTDAPSYFAWSDDGKQVAFSVEGDEQIGLDQRDQLEELYTVNADGTGLRHVGQGFSASWSSDSRYIVAIYGGANFGRQLVRFDLQDGTQNVLRKTRLTTFTFVSYSPDGKQLAVVSATEPDGFLESLYLTTPNGQLERVLVPGRKMPPIVGGNLGSRADW